MQIVGSLTPNSAAAERVFSMLKLMFGDAQMTALAFGWNLPVSQFLQLGWLARGWNLGSALSDRCRFFRRLKSRLKGIGDLQW